MIRTALIVTSLVGAGLEQEARLLKAVLESHDVKVSLLHYTDMSTHVGPVDVMFSLEVVMPRSLGLAERNYLFPNSEWWPPQNDQYLPRFHKILCKTQDCFEIWSRKVGMDRCAYTSFEAEDKYDPSIARELKFLHLAGKSEHRGTQAVMECWMSNKGLPPLTVICSNPEIIKKGVVHYPEAGSPTMWITQRVPSEEIRRVQNSHKYHILPSEYEGFGHALHEGIGCDAHVITTAGPSTWVPSLGVCPIAVQPYKREQRSLAELRKVDAAGVLEAVHSFFATKSHETTISPRHFFLRNRNFFRQTIWDEISQ